MNDHITILDTSGQVTNLDVLNGRAIAWHEQYGERGEFWPHGRDSVQKTVLSHDLSMECRNGWHHFCADDCKCLCHGRPA